MKYIAAAASDIGKRRGNQDSLCVKTAKFNNQDDLVMAIMCDGMGGLSKGEFASASLIRAFCKWFDEELSEVNGELSLDYIVNEWGQVVRKNSSRLKQFGEEKGIRLGTTFSGLFILNDRYMIMQIGDSRIYHIVEGKVDLLTEDQTLAMQEYKLGNISMEEMRTDSRKNVLLQSVGVTNHLKPVVQFGNITNCSVFVLCSDGQYHTMSTEDFARIVDPCKLHSIRDLRESCKSLISAAKENGEKDNISVILIKAM